LHNIKAELGLDVGFLVLGKRDLRPILGFQFGKSLRDGGIDLRMSSYIGGVMRQRS